MQAEATGDGNGYEDRQVIGIFVFSDVVTESVGKIEQDDQNQKPESGAVAPEGGEIANRAQINTSGSHGCPNSFKRRSTNLLNSSPRIAGVNEKKT